jgi:adenosylcobinamide kinase/adenosylcobinamide-phosphate guanylyltransferase
MPLTLLTGGTRSGKSALAIQVAARSRRPVVFVATAEARDVELAQRIDRHRAERPADWTLVEEPVALEPAIRAAPGDACVVVDCLSLWVANLLDRELSEAEALGAARCAAEAAAMRIGLTIAVTNEVGSGVVPATRLGRLYRDLLGHVNRIWADAAEHAALVVAGRVLELRRWHGVEA